MVPYGDEDTVAMVMGVAVKRYASLCEVGGEGWEVERGEVGVEGDGGERVGGGWRS